MNSNNTKDDKLNKSLQNTGNSMFSSHVSAASNQQEKGSSSTLFKSYFQKTWPLQSRHLSPSLEPIIPQSQSPKSNQLTKVADNDLKIYLPKVEMTRDVSSKYRGPLNENRNSSHSEISHNRMPHTNSNAAVSTMTGVKPGRPDWINQDSSFVLQTGRYMGDVYGIFDGHGEHGHLVAQLCKSSLPQLIMTFPEDLKKAFYHMQIKILNSHEMNVDCSGATCVVVVVRNQEVTVAHCGDSRCVLGRRSSYPGGGYHDIALTRDHKPDLPEELKRIVSCGGQVGSRQFVSQGGDRHPGRVTLGPCRVWYRHGTEKLGLAMSRSLGDAVVHRVGVSAEPTLLHQILEENGRDEFLVLATDGLWDVVDSAQAIRIVGSMIARAEAENVVWSPHEASLQLTQVARRRWETVSPMIDDITVLVVKLALHSK